MRIEYTCQYGYGIQGDLVRREHDRFSGLNVASFANTEACETNYSG